MFACLILFQKPSTLVPISQKSEGGIISCQWVNYVTFIYVSEFRQLWLFKTLNLRYNFLAIAIYHSAFFFFFFFSVSVCLFLVKTRLKSLLVNFFSLLFIVDLKERWRILTWLTWRSHCTWCMPADQYVRHTIVFHNSRCMLVWVIAWFVVIFGINTTSDISKFETILKYHKWYLCQISRTNHAIICLYHYPQKACNFHM